MKSWRVDHRELDNLKLLLESGFPGSSPVSFTAKLEREFAEKIGTRFAITFVNGTATLHGALAAAGVGPGDEVIVPPLTMASTSYAVLYTGAKPVYADVDPETFEILPESMEANITDRTKAVIPVSLYGLSPDLDAVMKIAEKHSLTVVEDDAECFLGKCRGRTVGSIGHFGSFSFQNSKHMTTGEGGILVTSDEALAEKARRFSSLGYGSVGAAPGKSKIDKALIVSPEFERHVAFGYNYRMSELCAAVACAQLEKLDLFLAERIKCAEAFAEVVRGVSWLKPQRTPAGFVNSYWTYAVQLAPEGPDWHEFYRRFRENGGEGFNGAWRLNYNEPYFRTLNLRHDCPNAERLQPRMMQFKTNYGSEDSRARQQEALSVTINHFERGGA